MSKEKGFKTEIESNALRHIFRLFHDVIQRVINIVKKRAKRSNCQGIIESNLNKSLFAFFLFLRVSKLMDFCRNKKGLNWNWQHGEGWINIVSIVQGYARRRRNSLSTYIGAFFLLCHKYLLFKFMSREGIFLLEEGKSRYITEPRINPYPAKSIILRCLSGWLIDDQSLSLFCCVIQFPLLLLLSDEFSVWWLLIWLWTCAISMAFFLPPDGMLNHILV